MFENSLDLHLHKDSPVFPGPALSQVKLRPCRGFPKSNGAIALGDSAARKAKGVGSWISGLVLLLDRNPARKPHGMYKNSQIIG